MNASGHVNVTDSLNRLREAAVAAKTEFEKQNKRLEASIEQARIELLDELAPYGTAVKRASVARWDAFVRMIDKAVTIPYAQFLPIHQIGLTTILLSIDR